MTDDKDTAKPEGAADSRSKRPTTVDLKASEFKSETSAPASEVPPAQEAENIPPPNEAWNQENAAPEAPRGTRKGLP